MDTSKSKADKGVLDKTVEAAYTAMKEIPK